jgi:Fe-Mn family superoxide dismutase
MINPFRRAFLLGTAGLASLLKAAIVQRVEAQEIDVSAILTYPYVVPPLPYGYDANEPAIDTQTMQLHHDKHHTAYVNNLNAVLKDHAELQAMPLHDLIAHPADAPEDIRTIIRNN